MSVKKLLSILMVAVVFSTSAFAQADDTISDEELRNYVVMMDSINSLTAQLIETLSEKVKSNDKMTGTRYNELSGIIMDETKLAKANATPQEISFIKEVLALKETETAKIQDTFQTLAKEIVGASTFNKIRGALKTDDALKLRYNTMMTALK